MNKIGGQPILRRMLGKTAALAVTTAVLAVLAVALVVTNLTDAEKQSPATSLNEDTSGSQIIGVTSYRGDVDPLVWSERSEIVARVTIERVDASRWNTGSGDEPIFPIGENIRYIYTPLQAKVLEYIKGTGPDELTLAQEGGIVGDVGMFSDFGSDLSEGDEAIVFLQSPGRNVAGWGINSAYQFDGTLAKSEADGHEFPVAELLSLLREAAVADADKTSD